MRFKHHLSNLLANLFSAHLQRSLAQKIRAWISVLRKCLRQLRALLPVFTTAEKTALGTLILLLASGAGLRTWEHAGVKIGPVDDWESLRQLVIGARETSAGNSTGTDGHQDPGRFSCEDDATAGSFESAQGTGSEGPLVLSAGMSFGKTRGRSSEGSGGGSSKKTGPSRPLDLNAAGEKALLSLPGVGPSTAKAILAYRAARGPFAAVDDLMQVRGIGPKKMETIRPFVRVTPKEGIKEETKEGRKAETNEGDGADGLKTTGENSQKTVP